MYEVWVEGYGAVTPLGCGADLLLKHTELAASPISLPQLDPRDLRLKPLRKWSSSAQFAYLAVQEAMGEHPASIPERAACVVGTNYSNLEAIVSLDEDARLYGVNNTNPGIFPETVLNAIGGHLAEKFQLRGVNVTLSDGDETGWKLIRYAIDLLQDDLAEEVVVCMVNRFPPEPFHNGSLPYSFRRESISALRLTRTGSLRGIRLRAGASGQTLAAGMHAAQPPLPPWSLPLALVQASLLLEADLQPNAVLPLCQEEIQTLVLDRPAVTGREGQPHE